MYSFMETLEALYFLSGIGLLIVAVIGLGQLKIARENAKMSAKRESLKLANDQINYYLTEVIRLANVLDFEITKHNIKFFANAVATIKGDSITIKLNSDKEEIQKLRIIAKPLVDTLNAMESFATYFTSKLADEKIAFKAVGKTYCDEVKMLLPNLIAFHTPNGYHKNVLELFLIWNERFEKEKLLEEKEDIEKKLLSVDNKTIKPLGTE